MGEKNDVICSFLSDPERFADFINGSIFSGKQTISAGELNELPYTGREEHTDRDGKLMSRLRKRDVAMQLKKGEKFAVIAVENQDELNFLMPYRCAEYDMEEYAKQIRRLIKFHEEAQDLEGSAEFLSKIKQTDRLNPVVTIVFYHGKDSWNACKELHDMIDFEKENAILKDYAMNYRLNLMSLQELEAENFQTGLRELIGVMQRRNSKEQLQKYYRENEERFRQMDADTFDAISVMVDRKELMQRNRTERMKEGKQDMCKALDDIENDAKLEGENRFALLIGKLLKDGRIKDVEIVTMDEEARRALYREYGIESE